MLGRLLLLLLLMVSVRSLRAGASSAVTCLTHVRHEFGVALRGVLLLKRLVAVGGAGDEGERRRRGAGGR